MPFIDYEATRSIKDMMLDSRSGVLDLDPSPYFQRYALSTSLTLNYGIKIEGTIDNEMLKEITLVEREISNFRSTSHNWQDYIPLMRLWPTNNLRPLEFKKRRGAYMNKLLNILKQRIADGSDKPCITGNILKDPESKLNDGQRSEHASSCHMLTVMLAEIMSICLTMVSAGLDTVPGNLVMCIAYLSSRHGQEIQERALREINKVYPNGESWVKCLEEEKVEYISALVKEVLRFWTVIPICLPRTSIKDIQWEGATIPAGTTFYMNAYAADYDEAHFKRPFDFNPDRYLNDDSSGTGTPHYGYGAGSRMCVGSHLANRELYTAFLRIITAFEILPPKITSDAPVLDCLGVNAIPTSLTMEPKPFKVGIKVRDQGLVERWISESEERTKDL